MAYSQAASVPPSNCPASILKDTVRDFPLKIAAEFTTGTCMIHV
ncbi:MAG: hypothetical protein ABJX82_10455 [Paracoccaceae bacterium]